jgi:hypothetical protein
MANSSKFQHPTALAVDWNTIAKCLLALTFLFLVDVSIELDGVMVLDALFDATHFQI